MRERVARFTNSKIMALLIASVNEFNADNGTLMAASISFNLLLSLFPLAFFAVFVASSAAESQNIQQYIISGIGYLLPQSRQLISSMVSYVTASSGQIGVLALIGLIWGGVSFFNAVRVSLNKVWGNHKPQSIYKAQFVNLIMLGGAGVFLIASVLLTTIVSTVEPGTQLRGIEFLTHSSTTRIFTNIAVTVLAFLVFLLLYKFIPNIRPRWKDVWISALAAAVCFEIMKVIFIRYLRIFHPYNLVYGSIGTVIAFLMWTYLSALVLLFVAKITYVNSKMRAGNAILTSKS